MKPRRAEELKEWVMCVMKYGLPEGNDLIELIDSENNRYMNTNLCETCQWGCIAECPSNPDIGFGTGIGDDNVIACHNYINREAYAKYQAM